jgi:hypothetical protein
MDYLEFIVRVTSHFPDKGQAMVSCYGLYANAHWGKVKKVSLSPATLRMAAEDIRSIPSKGWAEMIRKVCEVDLMVCPKCGGLFPCRSLTERVWGRFRTRIRRKARTHAARQNAIPFESFRLRVSGGSWTSTRFPG